MKYLSLGRRLLSVKRTMTSLAVLLTIGSSACFSQEIALLLGESGHNDEFKLAFERLGWKEPDKFECSAEGMKKFAENASKYDMIISVPLFNYDLKKNRGAKLLSKSDTNAEKVKEYIRNGGVMIFTDGSYSNVLDWLADIGPEFGGLTTGECTSSPWGVLGYVTNTEPIHPIRCFPNFITEGDSWPHFESIKPGSKWIPIANCSEGKPVCLYQKYGKGFVVLTCLRQLNYKLWENYYANCMLQKANLNVKSFKMTDMKPGPGTMDIQLSSPAPAGSSITLNIKDSKGREWSFTTNIVGTSCSLEYAVDARGEINSSLSVNSPAGEFTLFKRKAVIPELFEIFPNAYRGIISTKRRMDDVDFLVKFAPNEEDLTSADIELKFYDESSNLVFTAQTTSPTNHVEKLWIPVTLPKELNAGGYSLRATLSKGRIKAKSETSFEILAPRPAQAVIDEDNTFLVNGQPFFPLGIYHVDSDYDDVADIGFNTIQFWKWQVGGDKYGTPRGLHHAGARGLKCIFESNHWGEDIFKDNALTYQDHTSILMWYVADEPDEGAELNMRLVNNIYHKYDKQHPTFVNSCRPDLFPMHQRYGDVLGFDPAIKGSLHGVTNIIHWIKTAQAATDGRKALILVPWSTGNSDTRRHVAYAAIVHDIRGIVWYCWKQTGGGPVGIGLVREKDDQNAFKKFLPELKQLLPGLLSKDRRLFEEGDIHGIVCTNRDPRQRLIVMMNVSDKTVDADFVISEIEKARKIKDAITGKPVVIEKGVIKRKFKPFETLSLNWE